MHNAQLIVMKFSGSFLAKSFPILWRLSIFILPWQTRWIFIDGTLNGFSWEQGTISLYGGQILLAGTMLVGAWVFRAEWKSFLAGNGQRASGNGGLIVSAMALFIIVSTATASWTATGLWWLQVMLVAGFLLTLYVARIPVHGIARWFVIAIIPHAAIAVVQFFGQDIAGSTILGIAEHHPWVQGTSVVEHGLYRVLRAYGGFPHPNILGGWIVAGLVLLPRLIIRAKSKIGMIGYVFASVLFSTTLVFTFSRGAWVAGTLGFLLALIFAWKRSDGVLQKQAVALLGIMCACVIGLWLFAQFDHVKARFTTEHRLEAWSIETRSKAIADGIAAWELRPVTGWGPGAALVGVSEVRKTDEDWSAIAPEPPHIVPLAVLVETGVLGAIAFLALVIAIIQFLVVQRRWDALPLIIAGSAIAMTDHYLWTLWPGMALLGLLIFVVVLQKEDTELHPSPLKDV